MVDDYELLDSGDGAKLERFGPVVLDRPCAQALWAPQFPRALWEKATAAFDRERGNRWHRRDALPPSWVVSIEGMRFKLSGTDFGHLGVFPEQRALWRWIGETLTAARERLPRPPSVLNLFAYSGGATLAAARAGAEVCHLDASQGMVEWARENAALNGMQATPIRWIVDDAHKFMDRERRRGRRYDAIVLDPPTYGHGRRGEVYKLEHDIVATLDRCRGLLSDRPVFALLTSHTPLCTPGVLSNLLERMMSGRGGGRVESGEMRLTGKPAVVPVPNGSFARWSA
jgi:23S rRNA (cytosine1962-C5)-methyltransferase